MNVSATPIEGVLVVAAPTATDERGAFQRLFERGAFAAAGLPDTFPQVALSHNARAGTLRGLHFQRDPHAECKVVRCVRGALFDVALDLRPESPTRGRWYALELRAGDGRGLVVPPGCAHGFQTLADDTDVLYLITPDYAPDAADGVRWDDPRFAIAWPDPPAAGRVLSERDRTWPLVRW